MLLWEGKVQERTAVRENKRRWNMVMVWAACRRLSLKFYCCFPHVLSWCGYDVVVKASLPDLVCYWKGSLGGTASELQRSMEMGSTPPGLWASSEEKYKESLVVMLNLKADLLTYFEYCFVVTILLKVISECAVIIFSCCINQKVILLTWKRAARACCFGRLVYACFWDTWNGKHCKYRFELEWYESHN